jgi:hypothetical protein
VYACFMSKSPWLDRLELSAGPVFLFTRSTSELFILLTVKIQHRGRYFYRAPSRSPSTTAAAVVYLYPEKLCRRYRLERLCGTGL